VYAALSSIQIQLLKEEATCRKANIVMLKFLGVFLYEMIGSQIRTSFKQCGTSAKNYKIL
jgi:hypothetical protein